MSSLHSLVLGIKAARRAVTCGCSRSCDAGSVGGEGGHHGLRQRGARHPGAAPATAAATFNHTARCESQVRDRDGIPILLHSSLGCVAMPVPPHAATSSNCYRLWLPRNQIYGKDTDARHAFQSGMWVPNTFDASWAALQATPFAQGVSSSFLPATLQDACRAGASCRLLHAEVSHLWGNMRTRFSGLTPALDISRYECPCPCHASICLCEVR